MRLKLIRQSALRFAVVPESSGLSSFGGLFVSIRFKVRGGFRLAELASNWLRCIVSIRFEVRGGFRPAGAWEHPETL